MYLNDFIKVRVFSCNDHYLKADTYPISEGFANVKKNFTEGIMYYV